MYQKNYYEDLKDSNSRQEDHSSFALLTASGEFLWKNMLAKVLVLALLLTLIPLVPHIIKGDMAAYYDSISLANLVEGDDTPGYFLSGLLLMILQAYFIFSFFIEAKDFKNSGQNSKLFLKGLSKVLWFSIVAMLVFAMVTLTLGLILFSLGSIGVSIYALILFVLTILVQLFFISIMDDTRVASRDAWGRLIETLKNRKMWGKILFAVFLNGIFNLTNANITGLFEGQAKIYAGVITDFLSQIMSLILLAFISSAFILYSDHVRFYLPNAFKGEYGEYDEDDIDSSSSKEADHEQY